MQADSVVGRSHRECRLTSCPKLEMIHLKSRAVNPVFIVNTQDILDRVQIKFMYPEGLSFTCVSVLVSVVKNAIHYCEGQAEELKTQGQALWHCELN